MYSIQLAHDTADTIDRRTYGTALEASSVLSRVLQAQPGAQGVILKNGAVMFPQDVAAGWIAL